MTYEELKKNWYEFEDWVSQMPSHPHELIFSQDVSQSYEMDKRSIFLLENGAYVVVFESGCSCYTPSDAVIEVFQTLKEAIKNFERGWDKDVISHKFHVPLEIKKRS